MEKMISTKFKKNGKALKGKENKVEALSRLGVKPQTVVATKTYVMINGVPCNPVTKKPFTKVEA